MTTTPLTPAFFTADQIAKYRERGLWNDQNLWQLLADSPSAPTAVVLVDQERTVTKTQLVTGSQHLAAELTQRGLKPGDRIVVALPNSAEFYLALFACFWGGFIPVLALPSHREYELTELMSGSAAAALLIGSADPHFDVVDFAQHSTTTHQLVTYLTSTDCTNLLTDAAGATSVTLPLTSGAAPKADPCGLAVLQLSGGTTGRPKLIPRTHNDYGYSIRRSAHICALNQQSVYLAALPLGHNFPLTSPGALGTLWAGGTVVIPSGQRPTELLELIAKHQVTITGVVPPLAMALATTQQLVGADLSSLALCQVGGAPFTEVAARQVQQQLQVPLQQVYGMAEGLVCYTRKDADAETVLKTQGQPMSDYDQIRVVDEAGQILPAGQPGSLECCGPYTISQYYSPPGHPDQSRASFTADGFYRTGDLATISPCRQVTIVGRTKDQINRGGEKLSPKDVEAALLTFPGIAQANVWAVPDPLLGEKVHAVVVPRDHQKPPTIPQLREHFHHNGLAHNKVPDVLEIAHKLSVSHVGKPLKSTPLESVSRPS